jgi:hypothetical protein
VTGHAQLRSGQGTSGWSACDHTRVSPVLKTQGESDASDVLIKLKTSELSAPVEHLTRAGGIAACSPALDQQIHEHSSERRAPESTPHVRWLEILRGSGDPLFVCLFAHEEILFGQNWRRLASPTFLTMRRGSRRCVRALVRRGNLIFVGVTCSQVTNGCRNCAFPLARTAPFTIFIPLP